MPAAVSAANSGMSQSVGDEHQGGSGRLLRKHSRDRVMDPTKHDWRLRRLWPARLGLGQQVVASSGEHPPSEPSAVPAAVMGHRDPRQPALAAGPDDRG